jgi:hypothetical protein
MFSYTQWALDWLSKAAGHKYIKRVPYQSGGRMRYRYIYNVTHTHGGKHVLDPDHMKVGTKLMLDATSGAEVHGHIQSVSGDKVTFVYDDGPKKGESVTMSKDKLATELDKVHGISGKLDAARKKQSDVVAKLKEKGASAKQIARAEARLKALGGDTPKGSKDQTAEQKRAAHALSLAITEARKPRAEYKPKLSYSEEEYAVVNKLRDYAATQQGTARKMAIDFADRYKEAVTSHKRAMRSKPRAERVMLIPQMREAEMSLLDEMEQQLLSRQNATVQEQVTIAQPPRTSKTEAQTSTVSDLLSRARQATSRAIKQDTLSATGRRARASIDADKDLLRLVDDLLSDAFADMPRPLPSDINARTPQQGIYARLRGARNGVAQSQKLNPRSLQTQTEVQTSRLEQKRRLNNALSEYEQYVADQRD